MRSLPQLRLLITIILMQLCIYTFAQSGSYHLVSGFPSGGTISPSGASYAETQLGYGGSAKNLKGSASASGAVTYEWSWAGTSQPPTSAILAVTVTATYGGVSGSCSDGMGDSPIPNSMGYGATSSGTHYYVISGGQIPSFTLGGAAASGTTGPIGGGIIEVGQASVEVSASITPVVTSLSGDISPNGSPECLVGQWQNAEVGLAGNIPVQLSGWHWNCTGGATLFNDVVFPDSGLHEWDTDINLNDMLLAYYAATQAGETISCSATATVNQTGVVIGTVTASAVLNILAPTPYSDQLMAGQTSLVYTSDGSAVIGIQAGNLATNTPGMTFTFEADTPNGFNTSQSQGVDFFVQLFAANTLTGFSQNPSLTWTEPPSGDIYSMVLDGAYPYAINPGPFIAAGGTDQTNDSPFMPIIPPPPYSNGPNWTTSLNVGEFFSSFVVFTPPTPPTGTTVVDIPLMESEWNWQTSDTLNASDDWPPPSGNPQVVGTASGAFADFQWDNTYSPQ
jgi:hypothetical protein